MNNPLRPRRRLAPLLALGALAALVTGCPDELQPIEPITIALLNPLTGSLSGNGPYWEDAGRLAAEQVNSAGGLFDGRRLQLVFHDTRSTPSGAAEATREAIEAGGAVAIVGPASSAEAEAMVDVVEGFDTPMISCCATSPSLTAADDWFFRTTPNDLLQAKAAAFVAKQGWPPPDYPDDLPAPEIEPRAPCVEALVVYRDDSYGTDLAAVFVEEFEGQDIAGTSEVGRVVANVSYASDVDTPDGAAVAAAAMTQFNVGHQAAVDAVCVLLVSFAPDGNEVIRALDQQLNAAAGDPATFTHKYLATDGLYDDAFASSAQGFGLQVIGTAPTHAANTAYTKFANAYRARFGVAPGSFTSNTYDGVVMLALAVTSTRSTDGDDIREALFDISHTGRRFDGEFFGTMAEALLSDEDIDYVGPSGELDFDENGDVVGDFSLWQPVREDATTYRIEEKDFLPAALFDP